MEGTCIASDRGIAPPDRPDPVSMVLATALCRDVRRPIFGRSESQSPTPARAQMAFAAEAAQSRQACMRASPTGSALQMTAIWSSME